MSPRALPSRRAAGGSIYCATKAGLRSYTQAIRYLLQGQQGPGDRSAAARRGDQHDRGRGGKKMTAHDCAAEIVHGIRTGKTEVNAGMVKMLQLVHSISPALARRIMIKF